MPQARGCAAAGAAAAATSSAATPSPDKDAKIALRFIALALRPQLRGELFHVTVLLRQVCARRPTPLMEVNVRALQFVVPADRVERGMYFSQFMGQLRLIVNQFEHQPVTVV